MKTPTMVVWLLVLFVPQTMMIQYLWNWFIQPFGVMPLTFWHALGLITMVAVARRPRSTVDETDKTRMHMVTGVMACLIFGWGLGALAHWGMG